MKILATLLMLAIATALASQGRDELEGLPDWGACPAGRIPRTTEEILGCRGVQPTKQALLEALGDSRADVRSLAAQTLAQDGQEDSIPAIATAFSVERASGTRMIMAYALALLGERPGVAALRNMCKDSGASAAFRMAAVGYMLRLNGEECVDDLIDVLQSVRDSSSLQDRRRDGFLQVGLIDLEGVPLEHPSESQLKEIRGLAVGCLSSKSPDLRMAASRALGKFGDTVSAQELERALAAEQDEAVRARMLGDLQRMKDRQHEPGGNHN